MGRSVVVLLCLGGAAIWAGDPPTSVSLALVGLKIELEKEAAKLPDAGAKTTDRAVYRRYLEQFYNLSAPYSQKALQLAVDNPTDPGAFAALAWIATGPFAYSKSGSSIERGFQILIERYANDPGVLPICNGIGRFGLSSTKPEQFLRAVIERNQSRFIRATACLKLGDLLCEQGRYAQQVREASLPSGVNWNEAIGPEMRDRLLQTEPVEFDRMAERAYRRLAGDFADVQVYPDRTAAELARGQLFRLQELVVGKPLPPIDGFGFKGQPVNSTIHQGKVLVLVFWASWWAPSIEIAEQERDLARRFQDKPVVLLGISGDNSLESAQQVADREKMSWPLIFDGNSGRGPIATSWGITTWPTVFVVDANNVIRHVGYNMTKVNEIVTGLLNKSK